MKLDSRIIEGKKPFDCTDAESEAVKSFIGKKGYFADHISEFKNISDLTEDVLKDIAPENFDYEVYDAGFTHWQYFLPAEWVKSEEPEKKYRPYSLEEFLNIFHVGDLIHFRRKNDDEIKVAMFTGYITDVDRIDDKTPGAVELMLGSFHYSLFSLFDEGFEVFFEDKWQPFGIIDKDKE